MRLRYRASGADRLRLPVGVALAGVLVLVAAVPALAHAVLLEARPADGTALEQPPSEVALRFSEPVDPPPDAIRVVDAQGNRVDDGAVTPGETRAELRVGLRPGLADGAYLVAWRVISADSHPVAGSLSFFVGDDENEGLDPGAVLADPALGPYAMARNLLQGLLYALVLFAAGGLAFVRWVHDGGRERRRLLRLVAAAAAAAVGLSALLLLLQAMVGSGLGLAAVARLDILTITAVSTYGLATGVRTAALVLVVALLWRPDRRGTGWALAAAAAALASFSLTGHTAVTEPRWLVVSAHLLHVGAAAVWFGGLVMLAWVLRLRRPGAGTAGDGGPPKEAAMAGAALVARFSAAAAGTLVLLLAAGVALAWTEVRTLQALTTTPYGTTLLAKVGLAAVVLGIAVYNNRRLLPRVGSGGQGAWRRLSRTITLELAGLLLVLLVTTWLINLVPARLAGL